MKGGRGPRAKGAKKKRKRGTTPLEKAKGRIAGNFITKTKVVRINPLQRGGGRGKTAIRRLRTTRVE